MLKTTIFVLSVLSWAPALWAQRCTIYVSPSGTDSSAYGSAGSPLATPHRAVQIAVSGDVICLRAGTYTFTTSLNIAKSITLMSYPGENAILTGSSTDTTTLLNMVVVGASRTLLQDLEIRGGSYYGVKVTPDLLGIPPANVSILRCKIHDTGRDAVKTQSADSLLIQDSEIYNSGVRDPSNAEGIDVIGSIPAAGGSGFGIIVRGNYIHDIATNGLYLKGGTVAGLVERNLVQRVNFSGIMLGEDTDKASMRNRARYECAGCIARNNIVIGAGAAGFACMAASNPVFEFNTAVDVARTSQDAFRAVQNASRTPCANVFLKNNVFVVNSKRSMITLQNVSGGIASDYNAWLNTTNTYTFVNNSSYLSYSQWRATVNADWNSLEAVDLLLDPNALYGPLAGSPLIDRGLVLSTVTIDYAGITRPQGAGVEIGAHEVIP